MLSHIRAEFLLHSGGICVAFLQKKCKMPHWALPNEVEIVTLQVVLCQQRSM